MAVATHVSRVSKEYAPYGYSIMSNASVSFNKDTAFSGPGGAAQARVVLYCDDADLEIESAFAMITQDTAAGGDHWTITIQAVSMAGARNLGSISSAGGLSAGDLEDFALTGGNRLNFGEVLQVVATPVVDGGGTPALGEMSILFRLRRKA